MISSKIYIYACTDNEVDLIYSIIYTLEEKEGEMAIFLHHILSRVWRLNWGSSCESKRCLCHRLEGMTLSAGS